MVHASRTLPEIDNQEQIFELGEPKLNVLSLSSSLSSNPMSQSDNSGRQREIQFVDEGKHNGLEESLEPKCNVASPSPYKLKSECVHPKTEDNI